MIQDHLPALQIILPMLAAPVVVLLRRPRYVWPFAITICWLTFAISVAILQRVLDAGTISYALGGWQPPVGIELRVDLLNAYLLPIVSGIGAVVATFAPRSLSAELPESKRGWFFTAYLLCMTGLMGMTITGDAFNVFVFLEISSLSMYTLVALGPRKQALVAAYRYLIQGTIGGTFILIGIGLLYMMTGTLNMADLAVRLRDVPDGNRAVLAGFAFLTVGTGLKMALFPLHTWLPNAYAYAPSVVTSFLAATATKVSVYVLLRFLFTVFGFAYAFETLPLAAVLVPLGILGIVVSSTVACFQNDVKRLLAFSSVAQIGYIVLGLGMASEKGLIACLVHIFNHAVTKGGLFMVLACMALRVGTTDLNSLKGIGRRMPFTMMAFVTGGLSLIGVPTTVGFISKWYLVTAAIDRGSWALVFLIMATSLLSVIYIWRVIETAYFKQPDAGAPEIREAPLSMLIPTWVMIGSTLYFGLNTDLSVGVAQKVAAMLMGGA